MSKHIITHAHEQPMSTAFTEENSVYKSLNIKFLFNYVYVSFHSFLPGTINLGTCVISFKYWVINAIQSPFVSYFIFENVENDYVILSPYNWRPTESTLHIAETIVEPCLSNPTQNLIL